MLAEKGNLLYLSLNGLFLVRGAHVYTHSEELGNESI